LKSQDGALPPTALKKCGEISENNMKIKELHKLGRPPAPLWAGPLGLAQNVDGRAMAARCEDGDEKDTKGSAVYFVTVPFVPLGRGKIVYMSHRGNDDDTDLKNRKTYGSVLVRFFGRKMHFAPIFRISKRICLAIHTA
jgi:hypothetical protein